LMMLRGHLMLGLTTTAICHPMHEELDKSGMRLLKLVNEL